MDNVQIKLLTDAVNRMACAIEDVEVSINKFNDIPKAMNRLADAINGFDDKIAGALSK